MSDQDQESTPPTGEATPVVPAAEPDRQAQPVDAEVPPRLPFPVVGLGASAGGLEAVAEFLDAMRPDPGMAFILVQHLPPDRESLLAEILGRRTPMPVRQVEDGMAVEVNHLYVIRPGRRLEIREGRLHFGPPLGSPRAANRPIDDFFKSLAEEQRERAIAVVLSGMGSNGTAGAQAIKAVGGFCIAQDPESAHFPSMPRHLIDAGYADAILRPAEMPEALLEYAGQPYTKGAREAVAAEALRREGQHLREILAVLRTRARHDFSGYKAPTLLRRIQRRMGLVRVGSLVEYARYLRQNGAEVTALADDLLIHVTGFFRDPEAWEALRQRVIVPLVAGRDSGAPVRAWVAACASGEEAYTLAMLLQEESDRAGKRLDIKVFATDLAERTLSQARAGVYPGGIESEIEPERLERFFSREDEVYRVRPQLRDRVVFAPQNLLQDPPFSRLDIATCRNLLIYLEPEVQRRVLALLHFGLREGGALFLGSNETINGAEELFEPIDKKARIFRRVGPTRHGTVEFPLPHAVPGDLGLGRLRVGPGGAVDERGEPPRREPSPPSAARLAERILLEAHTPPSVTIDRDGRILYYHGDTRPFLQQPAGEPTRELSALLREGLRGAVRVALHRAAADGAKAVVPDGWVEVEPGRRIRVAILVSPIDPGGPHAGPGAPPEAFVVSFADQGAFPPAPAAADESSPDELRRLRAELQSTIEELQSSNEELKASHEEVMSINEELQSANEELETSKEEMQSLNEELTTVNAQLRAKMEEHQSASSDLASLLASTDIAVLFLDTAFRIRRYTPAIRDLVDLISSDIGRPLAALARRFDDPNLDEDCRAVLERLVPVEREVGGADGRHYLRRVLPYRTTDNRIDGVVITFVDITPRVRAELDVRASEEQFRRAIEEAPIPVIMQAEDGRVLQVSRTWTELTGYALADVPTLDAWLTRAYGQGADEVRAHMHELFRGDRKTLDVEFAIRTRAGAERCWSFSASAPGTLRDGRRFVVGMAVDITERRAAEERQAFLLALSDGLRPLADAAAIQAEAARLLGERLGVNRVLYAEASGDDWVVAQGYVQGVEPLQPGRLPTAPFGAWIIDEFRAGRRLVIRDVRSDDRFRPSERATHEARQIVAAAAVPLVKAGTLAGILVAQHAAPRDWSDEDLALIEETAERTWASVERARAEAALAAELDAMTRLRELSERLLTAEDLPTGLGAVLDTAIALHAADRGTVQVYDTESDVLRYAAARGFDTDALAAIPPVDRDFHSVCAAAIRTGERVIVADIPADPRFTEHVAIAAALGYRAAFSFPLTTRRGEFQGVLTVHFRDRREPDERELRWAALYAPLAAHLVERARADQALRESEEKYRSLFESMDEAYAVVEVLRDGSSGRWADFRFLEVNPAFGKHTGVLHPVGRTGTQLLGTPNPRWVEVCGQVADTGEPMRLEEREPTLDRVFDLYIFRLGGPGSTRVAVLFTDITARKRGEAALRAGEERLRLSLAAARMGIWTWDVATDIQTRDANLNRLLGRDAVESNQPLSAFLEECVHPADREAVAAALTATAGNGRPLSLEFRIVRPDGAVRWLRDQGDAFGAPESGSPQLAGACVDITDLKEAEAAVREREDRLRLILAGAVDYAILTLDAERRVTSWSPGAEAVFGYAEAEILGRSADLIFVPEDRDAAVPEAEVRTALHEGRAGDERWHLREDGTRFFASGVLTPLGEGGALGFVKVLRDLTDRKRMEDDLREARDRLEETVARRTADLQRANAALRETMAARTELLRRVTTTEEDERRRISRELHDRLGQELTALGLTLRALEGEIPPDAPGRDRLLELERIVNGLGREAHDLAVELRPTVLDDVGLAPALAAYVARWSERTGVAAELQPIGLAGDRLPEEVATTVYRVVQEALTNVARHAGAGRVSVLVSRQEDGLVVVVEDNGRGFDPDAAGSGSGRRSLGLLGMRERIGLVGGTLTIESSEGQGTLIQARIPLPAHPGDVAPAAADR